jgi:uncharacterized protein YbbC (DUF1343 family)
MKKDPLYKLIKKSESIGLLCNHTAWHASNGQYSFQSLAATGKLKQVYIPEHGLFGELQDQSKLDNTSIYSILGKGIEWISLYNSVEHSLTATNEQLYKIDTLIIDIQDAGSRYYTYTSTISLLLKRITFLNLDIKVIVLDKPNPAGRQVEGTRMEKKYASFIGVEGLLHRHGLTIAELCRYFKNKMSGEWKLFVYPISQKDYVFIAPSPNIPSIAICNLYSGQCLWEGTNISEGRGTTLPFETIGAPFLDWVFEEDWNNTKHPLFHNNCIIRPTRFVPVFHKYTNETCSGFQLIPNSRKEYHSLGHSLQLIKYVKEKTVSFEWRAGKYEAFNDRKAIDLLVGDSLLLDFLEEKASWKEVRQKMNEEEREWIKEVSPFLIYKPSLQKLKLN